jgi:hypothetical protein
MQPTFRERYCRRWELPSEQFEAHLFDRALYPPARWLRALLLWIWPDYFSADREFMRCVGDIRSRRFFHAEAGEFHTDASNGRFLRRWLRLRVSAERTRRLMEECWGTPDSRAPVETSVSSR